MGNANAIVAGMAIAVFPTAQFAAQPPSFHDAIRNFAKARDEIKSYEVVITANVRDEGLPQRATNGVTYPATEKRLAFTLQIAADLENGKLLVVRDERIEDLQSGFERAKDRRITVVTPSYIISASEGRGFVMRPGPRTERWPCFDPLAIGIAFEGDLKRGDPLRKIIENYTKWPDLPSKDLGGGIIQYGAAEDDRAEVFHIDSRKGYSPVRLKHRAGNGGVFHVTLDLNQVKSHWLPALAVVNMPGQHQYLRFDWKSVNAPVSDRFSVSEIEAKYGIDLTDRR